MKNIIFDWSGVVKDTVTAQLWIINKIFEKYDVEPITMEEFRENWQQPYIEFYKKYLKDKFTAEGQEEAYKEFVFHKDCPKTTLFPEMVELIKTCKEKGYFLFVVSADLADTLLPEIKEFDLENIFDEIYTDTDNKLEAVEKIIKENNLKLEETFFIGDSNHETEVSKETGIKNIAVTWGFTSESNLKKGEPDYLANNPKELEDIIF